jgi:hypothetical protein
MMMKNLLRAGAFLLALSLAPLASVSAHDKHGRKHRHARGRRELVRTHDDDRNPTPGIPRRVRRGRNMTPGTPRGSIVGTPSTFPTDEGRRLGREVRRDEGRGGASKGIGMGVGKGGGRGRGKH